MVGGTTAVATTAAAAAGGTTAVATTMAGGTTAVAATMAGGTTATAGRKALATATVQLTMTGELTDYTAAKIDTIRSDLAALDRINASDISMNVVPAGSLNVLVLATMPAAQAAIVFLKINAGTLKTLGSQQVRKWCPSCRHRQLCANIRHLIL